MSQTDLALDVIRKKVFFHNSVDVWISVCDEKNIEWNSTENYKKFISYLLKNNLQLKAFNLCAHEAGAVEEGLIPDSRDAITDRDARQVSAFFEGAKYKSVLK